MKHRWNTDWKNVCKCLCFASSSYPCSICVSSVAKFLELMNLSRGFHGHARFAANDGATSGGELDEHLRSARPHSSANGHRPAIPERIGRSVGVADRPCQQQPGGELWHCPGQ